MSTAPNTSRKAWVCSLYIHVPGAEWLGDILCIGGADGESGDLLSLIPRTMSLIAFAAKWRWCLIPWVFQLLPMAENAVQCFGGCRDKCPLSLFLAVG